MPKYFEELGLVFFFYSREFSGNGLEPVHVHVSEDSQSDINDKFWVNFGVPRAYGGDPHLALVHLLIIACSPCIRG